MCRCVVFGGCNFRVDIAGRRIEHSELDARGEQASQCSIEDGLGQQAMSNGTHDAGGLGAHVIAVVAADQIHAGLEGHGHTGLRVRGKLVPGGNEDIGGGTAIRHDIPLKAPVLAQVLLQQQAVRACRLTIHGVVGTHDGLDFRLCDSRTKGRQVSVFQIVARHLNIRRVACGFRAAVHGEVLRRCDGLQVLRVIALQARDERHAHARGEIRVFAVGFLATTPARIAEDVDVG